MEIFNEQFFCIHWNDPFKMDHFPGGSILKRSKLQHISDRQSYILIKWNGSCLKKPCNNIINQFQLLSFWSFRRVFKMRILNLSLWLADEYRELIGSKRKALFSKPLWVSFQSFRVFCQNKIWNEFFFILSFFCRVIRNYHLAYLNLTHYLYKNHN